MSTVYADTLEPSVPTKNTTLGATGDSITIGANSINTNVIQDSGGNVLFQSDGSGTLSNVNSAFSNNLKLLSTQTASNDTSVSFTSGIDSTYDVYMFKFIDMRTTSGYDFGFQASTNAGSSYATTITSTAFRAYQPETGSGNLSYESERDRSQQTVLQSIVFATVTSSDGAAAGELYLFNPSSTTYVKHFYSTVNFTHSAPASINAFVCGYFNTTSAINAITFASCNGDGSTGGSPILLSGTIKMYGL